MATIVQLAGMLPRDPKFRAFVEQFMPAPVTVDDATHFIRAVCAIDSRRELTSNPDAEKRFHEYLRRPFLEWREQQH